jgi:hypothetical protein
MTGTQSQAIAEIRRLADLHGLAVSTVTPADVLLLKGIENPTPEHVAALHNSYEWQHYGDNWADNFEGYTVGE